MYLYSTAVCQQMWFAKPLLPNRSHRSQDDAPSRVFHLVFCNLQCFSRLFLPLFTYYAFFTCFSATLCIWLQDLNAEAIYLAKGFIHWLTANCAATSLEPPLLPCQLAPRLQPRARSSLMCVCLVCSVRSHDDPPCTAGRDWSCRAEARCAAATNRHSCGRQCF